MAPPEFPVGLQVWIEKRKKSMSVATIRKCSVLLLEKSLIKLADDLTVKMIMTNHADLVVVQASDTVALALERMGSRYDQLPVIKGNKIIGMVHHEDIASRTTDDLVAEPMRPIAELGSLQSTNGFCEAVERLQEHEYLLIFTPDNCNVCGLLHYSDLNKQAVRVFCYLWISALEMGMAEYLAIKCSNMDDWLPCLEESRQMDVRKRHELEKRKNIELGATEGLELSDLTKLYGKMSLLLDGLGLSKKEFTEKAGRVVEFRHKIMHPVRSLLHDHADVAKLKRRLDSLRELVEIMHRVIDCQER